MSEATFQCSACQRQFQSTRSDEDAEAEFDTLWAAWTEDARATLCEDCWQLFMFWYQQTTVVAQNVKN